MSLSLLDNRFPLNRSPLMPHWALEMLFMLDLIPYSLPIDRYAYMFFTIWLCFTLYLSVSTWAVSIVDNVRWKDLVLVDSDFKLLVQVNV
jgi:hypothetical protein